MTLPLRLLDASISQDDGSPFWLADLSLSDVEDYARIQIGDPLELTLWGVTFNLICDGRRFARGDDAPYTLSAISPAALLGAPWSEPVTLGTVGMARAVVELLLGQAVDWRLVDWVLPASASELRAAPLDLARQIVAAVGGVIESNPDGSLRARPVYPVSPLEYASASPAAILTDRDLLGHSDSADVADLDNRFVITSGDPEATTDQVQVESEQDPNDPHAYTIRAYPHPWRQVDLVHTGDSATQIGARAEAWTDQDELIEIVAGSASLKYPSAAIVATRYQHADLGRVTVAGREVATAAPDYSLLNIQYRARCWEWRATNARTETIQFLAVE